MFTDLKTALRPALVLTALFTLLLGFAYPLALTGLGQLVFPAQANGSLIRDAKSEVIGSALIGQSFATPGYFHGRPSAAGQGYDALASAGSNLGPASKALAERLSASPDTNVPPDLVTTSASGLDPDISPEAAFYQVGRVAGARGIDAKRLEALVEGEIDRPLLGFIGEPRVNVLQLNRALDRLTGPDGNRVARPDRRG